MVLTPPLVSTLALLLTLFPGSLRAQPIQGLFGTGVDDTNNPLAVGNLDPHFLAGGLLEQVTVVNRHPAWATPPAPAAWVGPSSGVTSDPPGDYTYTLLFDLGDVDPDAVTITGLWATDNNASILLNGEETGITSPPKSYRQFTPFTIDTNFVTGINTLEFVVTNETTFVTNPTGFSLADLHGAVGSVPEPPAVALVATTLAFALRRYPRRD